MVGFFVFRDVTMPKSMLDKLPDKAKDIYEAAWQQAKDDGRDDETAAKVAIAAVKRAGYAKGDDDKWHKMRLVSMHITKAAMGGDGVMRWAATTTKFSPDEQGDEVTSEFYQYAKAQVAGGKRPDPVVCISHIDKGRPSDDWVAGNVTDFYIDGGLPKAKGIFRDTSLGKAAFEAVRADYGKSNDEKIRISLGFYDEEHEPLQTQKADGSTVEGRRFLKGWIKHLALTRVPVVKETEISIEELIAMAKTKKEDAASIVGAELAEELVREDKAEVDEGDTAQAKADTEADVVQDEPEEKAATEAEASGRRNQIIDLLDQLSGLLTEEWTVDTEVANAAALSSPGTNPPTTVEMSEADDPPAPPDTKAQTLASRQPTRPEEIEVAAFVDNWAMQVKAALLSDGDRQEKFVTLQQLINTFGEGVAVLVKDKTPPSSRDIADVVSDAVRAAVEPVQNQLAGVKAELDEFRRKAAVLGTEPVTPAPEPRSLDSKARVIQPQNTFGETRKARTARELAWLSTSEGPGY
jgi:cation transport regulator